MRRVFGMEQDKIVASLTRNDASLDNAGDTAPKAPISTHRAFPPIVALWFAALLGLGSLVVPVAVVERLVTLTGLASLVPQTAPPLGFTARALIALGFTLAGAIGGLLLARRMGQAHSTSSSAVSFKQTVAAFGARQPISAHAELGDEGLDGNGARGRRFLTMTDDSPSDMLAPAPTPIVKTHKTESAPSKPAEKEGAAMMEPRALDLSEFSDSGADEAGFASDDKDDAPRERQEFITADHADAADEAQEDASAADAVIDTAWVEDEAVAPEVAPEVAPDPAPPQFAQPDTHQPDTYRPDTKAQEENVIQQFSKKRPAATSAQPPRVDGDEELLDNLGMVQLAERLGASLHKRRAMQEAKAAQAATAAASPARPAPTGFDIAEQTEAAEAMEAYFAKPAVPEQAAAPSSPGPLPMPEAVETQASDGDIEIADEGADRLAAPYPHFDSLTGPDLAMGSDGDDFGDSFDDDFDDLAHSFSLPLGRAEAAPQPSDDGVEDLEDVEDVVDVEANAASIAPAPNPFKTAAQEFVRIEDEPDPEEGSYHPAVIFPGEGSALAKSATSEAAPPQRPFDAPAGAARPASSASSAKLDPQESDRALREALLNLQRMSGAA